MLDPRRISRTALVAIYDFLCGLVAINVAYLLRLNLDLSAYTEHLPSVALTTLVAGVTIVAAGKLIGLGKLSWRYVALDDVIPFLKSATIATAVLVAWGFLAAPEILIPRSVPVIFFFVFISLMTAGRVGYRLTVERVGIRPAAVSAKPAPGRAKRLLIIGLGSDAEAFLRSNLTERPRRYAPVGILAGRPNQIGSRVFDTPVIGTIPQITDILDTLKDRIDLVAFAAEGLDPTFGLQLFEVAEQVKARGLGICRLRQPAELSNDGFDDRGQPLKRLDIGDLLHRRPHKVDRANTVREICGKTIMVTGGGGSVGSELCRQIASFGAARLIVYEWSEFNLYQIDRELTEKFPSLEIVPVLGDVRDRAQVEQCLRQNKPQIVFHAAALKHVPLVETNPCDGVLTNILGTKNLVDLAPGLGVEGVVLVSTDKAVNPSSFMGATKRIAEKYMLAAAGRSADDGETATRFLAVRFGNVLGSSGSVVPLFYEQVQKGGPVTVTHPEMERFFMTSEEAVLLILEGFSTFRSDSDEPASIYFLEMGTPVKIKDLAEQIIRLAGLEPYYDIDIQFSGIRAGEKLTEQLHYPHEAVEQTAVSGIVSAKTTQPEGQETAVFVNSLIVAARNRDDDAVLSITGHLLSDQDSEDVQSDDETAAA